MSAPSNKEALFAWMMEHDVRLRVSTAAIKTDADITAALVAHCVWCNMAHEPADLEAILANNIAPATIFAGGSVTKLLFENSRLWTIVRTALIKLRQLPDNTIAQIFALNTRLADAVIANQPAAVTVAPVAELPRFVISRTSAKITRQSLPTQATTTIGGSQFTIPITAPPVLPANDDTDDDDDATDSSGTPATEWPQPKPNKRRIAHLVVRESNRYHEYSTTNLAPCSYRGCDQGIDKRYLRAAVSVRIYDQTCWQSFFCPTHVEMVDRLATAVPPISFCIVCASTEFKLKTIPAANLVNNNLTRPLHICTECVTKPHVFHQIALLKRRRKQRRLMIRRDNTPTV